MLRTSATNLLRHFRSAATQLTATRSMSLEGMKGYSEKEHAVENMYFTKEDQRALQKLLSKVKTQSDVKDRTAAAGVQAAEMVALNGIVGKYQVSQADLEALIRWKHTHY